MGGFCDYGCAHVVEITSYSEYTDDCVWVHLSMNTNRPPKTLYSFTLCENSHGQTLRCTPTHRRTLTTKCMTLLAEMTQNKHARFIPYTYLLFFWLMLRHSSNKANQTISDKHTPAPVTPPPHTHPLWVFCELLTRGYSFVIKGLICVGAFALDV